MNKADAEPTTKNKKAAQDSAPPASAASARQLTGPARQRSEAAIARRVAKKHGLNNDALTLLIAESRSEARRRRRRVSDTRLDELVRDLGAAR